MKLGVPSVGAGNAESAQQIAYYVIAVVLALVVLGGGYFVYVKPASSKASLLATRETELKQTANADAANYQDAERLSKVQLATLFDLTRAMPDSLQMADILVVLGRLAHNSGVQFQSIKPAAVVPLAGYQAEPMEIALQGNFYDLMEFLYELRHLVDVRQEISGESKLYATGRLFEVNKITIALSSAGDPNQPPLTATVDLDAFVYGSAVAPASPIPVGTTDTTTTSGSASAAGAPTGGSN